MELHSLERIIPDQIDQSVKWLAETLLLHMDRYRFAASFITGGKVLDMACGAGYGAYAIATEKEGILQSVTAVDIDDGSIAYAKERYAHPLISFVRADAMNFGEENYYDAIISLETIEHLPHPTDFIRHLKTILNENGKLICSVPVTPSVDANPYHLNDFTEKSFEQLLSSNGFFIQQKMIQVQLFSLFGVMNKKVKRSEELRKNLLLYYFTHPKSLLKRIYSTFRYGFSNRYIVAVCIKK